jgi:hypothetical protein
MYTPKKKFHEIYRNDQEHYSFTTKEDVETQFALMRKIRNAGPLQRAQNLGVFWLVVGDVRVLVSHQIFHSNRWSF